MSVIQSIVSEGVNWFEDFPYISLKTGTGKTTSAVLELRGYIEKQTGLPIDKVILLTPYKRTRKQVLADERFAGCVREISFDLMRSQRVEETIVSTYAGLCQIIKDETVSLDGCLLIFDELHTFIDFTRYQPQMSYLLEMLLTPELWEKFIAVGMTGTPKILEYCDELPFQFKDITPIAEMKLTCGNGLFVNGGSAESYAEYLIMRGFEGAKLFYVESAEKCYKIARKFIDAGYSSAFVVSSYHDEHTDQNGLALGEAMEKQVFDGLSIVDWLDEKSDIPANLNVLVINASVRDGINIKDGQFRFDEAVIESSNKSTVEQARSRIRHDLKQLTVIYNGTNKKRTFDSLEDAVSFFGAYEKASTDDERQRIMIDRLSSQERAKSEKINLDCVVLSGKSLFVNPFIKALTAYDLANYQFSKSRTFYDKAGNEITKQQIITYQGRVLPTFESWRDELKPLIGGKDFITKWGKDIRQEINNAPKLDEDNLSQYLKFGVWYDKEQLREIASEMKLRNANGDLMGYEYLISQLEKRYCVEHKKKQIKGVRKWRYRFSEK